MDTIPTTFRYVYRGMARIEVLYRKILDKGGILLYNSEHRSGLGENELRLWLATCGIIYRAVGIDRSGHLYLRRAHYISK